MGLFSSDDVEDNISQAIDQAKQQREGSNNQDIKNKQEKVERATQDAESLNKEVDRIKDGIEALKSQQKLVQERNENLYRALDVIRQEIEKEREKENMESEVNFENPEEVKNQISDISKKVKDTDQIQTKINSLENKIEAIEAEDVSLEDTSGENLSDDAESRIETLEMDVGVIESRLERELNDLREETDLRIRHSENELRQNFARKKEVQNIWDAIESKSLGDSEMSRDKLKQDIKEEIKNDLGSNAEYVERSEFEELRDNVKEMSDLVVKIARDIFN